MKLSIATDYVPEGNNPALMINELIESLAIKEQYVFGRPRKYDLRAMFKLVLFSYTRGVVSSRRMEQLARENLPARWLTQELVPSYRTICRFRTSDTLANLINLSLDQLVQELRNHKMIDDVSFIDGTKILADANKFSFVWKKNTIRFDGMNREAMLSLLTELNDSKLSGKIPAESELTLEMLDEIITRVELKLDDLDSKIQDSGKLSPNPDKQKRRLLKSKKRKLTERRNKMSNYQVQMGVYGPAIAFLKLIMMLPLCELKKIR